MSKRIDVNDLNVYYGDFLAVEGVSLQIEPRTVTAFIGPSGCGKSTFLRTLNRMHEVIPGARVEGEVLLDGDDLYGTGVDPVAVRRQVGMVFQRPNPFPTMSIKENVLAGVRLNNKRISKADADALVERSLQGANLWNEVKDRLKKNALGLSGGQQQRVSIARALAGDPSLILADEPTGALDSRTGREVLDFLKKLNEEGNTIVMITHQMDVVKQICDRVAVMNKGIVVEEGSVIDVFRRPQTETTKALIGNIMAQELPGSMLERVREQVADLDKGSVHILRLSFVGSEVTRPVISEASRMFNIDVNILLGQVDEVQGKGFGTLTILTSCNTDTFSQLLEYLRKHNVTVEEVTSHVL